MSRTADGGVTSSYLPLPAAPARSVPGLLGLSLRRTGGRRAVSAVTVLLLTAGASMFAFPAVTDLFGKAKQHSAQANFGSKTYQVRWKHDKIKVGEGLTRLIIDNDRVQVNVMVVEGTTLAALEAGAGHYVNTPLPCERGNVGIAGHRTTYGRPFNKINYMRPGDTVELVTPFNVCTYQVVQPPVDGQTVNPFVVSPTDFSVVSQRGELGTGHWLTLTSCNPLGSDAQRIVLRLKLIKKAPNHDTAAQL
jgi:sortase A